MPDLAERGAPAFSDAMRPVLYTVRSAQRETAATVTIVLEPHGQEDTGAAGDGAAQDPAAQRPEPIAPGQFNMLWSWGVGEAPISASQAAPGGALVHTIRDVGGVTKALCAKQPGDVVGVRGPFGRGWDIDTARGRDLVVVGGGIGLAPLRPVVHAILDSRADFGRVALVVGARSASELLFRSELDSWWRDSAITVRTIVDRPSPDWHGSVGIVTNELPRLAIDPVRTVVMVCGPEVMMRFVALNLIERGVAPEAIQVSLERNMQCAVGQCGHCQLAGYFLCRDGPVLTWDSARPLLEVREL
ncbi:MAG: FAD/NAD(P)-binding protein [Acidimicrobiales bacterium]